MSRRGEGAAADPGEPSTLEEQALLDRAEELIGYRFKDRTLLKRAITHPSVYNRADADSDAFYERLEFLGDAVLGFLIAAETYRRFPKMREGGMTRIRGALIAGSVQSEVAGQLGLADVIILGGSEKGTGGRGLHRALEDAYEAITGAIYLDSGLRAARAWMLRTMGPLITEEAAASPRSPKSVLQELVQADAEAPVYLDLGHSGPPHDRRFTVAVEAGGKRLGQGMGRTKKEAEAAAAEAALDTLRKGAGKRSAKGS